MTDPRWTLVIHGGAGQMTRESVSAQTDAGTRAGLAAALDAGGAILAAGGTALDAVEAAVRVLEDDPHFNAGRGAALTIEGMSELDAAVMNGSDRRAGAVAGIRSTRNPVTLARTVMTRSPHVFLGGKGADQFARDEGVEQVDPDWFVTDARRQNLAELKARGDDAFDVDMKYGTVGAVARDTHGHVAAATSTGGVTGKRWGRIGDSPVIGSGTYADDRGAAVSCTGAGEFFLRVGAAGEVSARVRLSDDALQTATDAVLADILSLGGRGGMIATDAGGEAVWSFTTPGMNRGSLSSTGERRIAIYGDE